MTVFSKTGPIGRWGEKTTIDFLRKNGYNVIDEADKHLGYDICANGTKIEIKTDLRIGKTHNFFIETGMINAVGQRLTGWLDSLEAKYIWYNDPKNNYAYILDVLALRELIRTKQDLRYYQGPSPYVHGETVCGYLLPISDAQSVICGYAKIYFDWSEKK